MYSWYGRGTGGVSGELSWKLPENWDVHDVVVHGFVGVVVARVYFD